MEGLKVWGFERCQKRERERERRVTMSISNANTPPQSRSAQGSSSKHGLLCFKCVCLDGRKLFIFVDLLGIHKNQKIKQAETLQPLLY